AFLCLCSPLLSAQPFINYRGIVNAASAMPAGLPGGAIAQGSIFSVFGSGLGPTTAVQASSFPLSPALGGVSIKVSKGSSSVDAIPIYVSDSQINAIMPSNTPVGRVSAQVSYKGVVSNIAAVTVAEVSFGTFSVSGYGPGIVMNFIAADQQPVNSLMQVAAPKQIETLWGTGLGGIRTSDTNAPPAGTLPVQVEVFVGGKAAVVQYSGRSPCCSGVDQIVFSIPADAPLGCHVPIQVRAGGVVSNMVTIAI